MSEVTPTFKLAHEKAREILGEHEPDCGRCRYPGNEEECPDNPEFRCTCPPFDTRILVAAIRGRLHRKPPYGNAELRAAGYCLTCGQASRGTTICAQPIDDALRWQLLKELHGTGGRIVFEPGQPWIEDWIERFYVSTHDAGLLTREVGA